MASSEKNFKCNFCGKSYTTKGILITHLKKIHNEKYKAYQCRLCSESFFKKNDVVQHRDISHKEDKEYICILCDKSFAIFKNWKSHMLMVHENRRH